MDSSAAIRLTGLLTGGFFSLIMIGLGIPFTQRKIGPNGIAGIRIPATMNDPEVWYDANAYGGRLMVWIGVVTGLSTLLYFVPGVGSELYMGLLTIGILVTSMFLVVKSVNYVRALTTHLDIPVEDASGLLRVGFTASAIATAVILALSAYAWPKIPAGRLIITHWGRSGPDGYSTKLTALIVYPVLMIVGITVLFSVIGWATARAPGIGKQKWIVPIGWILMMLIFVLVHVFVVTTALKH